MNIKQLAGLFLAACSFLASCSKEPVTGVDEGKYIGAKMVGFNNYEGYIKKNIDLVNAFVPVDVVIKLSNTTNTASSPITVRLIKNNSAISEYNTGNGTTLEPLPVTAYRFDSTNVVIPTGARTANIRFEVNPSLLNLSTTYAFGVSISSVSGDGATVTSRADDVSLVVELSSLNKYDGIYTVTGTFEDVLNPTVFTSALPNTAYLVTTSATSVTVYRNINNTFIPGYLFLNNGAGTYYGNWGAIFTFNPTTDSLTTVTNYYGQGTNTQGRSGAIDPTGGTLGNKFNAANHSVRAKYFMMQPNATTIRAKFNEIYTYVGPR